MAVRRNLTPVTASEEVPQYIRIQIARQVAILHENVKTWDAVADCLKPYFEASGASWWNVSQGNRITVEKANAVRRYYGERPLRKHYPPAWVTEAAQWLIERRAALVASRKVGS